MESRVNGLKLYLTNVIKELTKKPNILININLLKSSSNNYSLDRIPTDTGIETWIDGTEIYKDIYSFRSRNSYSQDEITNLKSAGFFEEFEKAIKTNNEKGILPKIEGIEEIECLNSGTMVSSDGKTAEFDIQIQITYKEV